MDEQLEALVRQFSRLVTAVAAKVGGGTGREIGEDVEQQVFLNLSKQLSPEQIIDNQGSSIYRCAVRETARLLNSAAHVNGHPDEATWERLATGVIDPAARDAALNHVTSCEGCSRIWRGVLTLQREAQLRGLIPADARSSRQRWRTVVLAVGATLALIVGGITFDRWLINNEAKSGANAPVLLDEAATRIGADALPTLTWTATPGATRYLVEMFFEDGRQAWSLEVETPSAQWPADVLRAPGVYRWRVDALNGGAVLARSRVATLTVAH